MSSPVRNVDVSAYVLIFTMMYSMCAPMCLPLHWLMRANVFAVVHIDVFTGADYQCVRIRADFCVDAFDVNTDVSDFLLADAR